VTRPSFRVAVAGTHSTGKSTFLAELRGEFERQGVSVAYVHDSALNAQQVGFPILADHTFESTAWLIGRAIELETAATLQAEVILIDRPVLDALGYLLAALAHTERKVDQKRLTRLEAMCAAWSPEYDLFFLTVLDPDMSIGAGRDGDHGFRRCAAEAVANVVERYVPERRLLLNGGRGGAIAAAIAAFEAYRDSYAGQPD
jgi:hypothetical protein